MLRFIVVAFSLALLPAAQGEKGGSWLGKKVLPRKSGVRISQTDDQGRRRDVATLTAMRYIVEQEKGDAIQLRHWGLRGWPPGRQDPGLGEL
jgi:hypothetical protein